MLMEDKFTEVCKKDGKYKAQLEAWVMQNWLKSFPTTLCLNGMLYLFSLVLREGRSSQVEENNVI